MMKTLMLALLQGACLLACPGAARAAAEADVEAPTRALHAALRDSLPLADTADFEDARRGFIATIPDALIKAADGRVVWSLRDYAFLAAPQAPLTVHPGLWRQAQLNAVHGLFKVVDRIYQIRGFDISNMTIVEGETGLFIIDPLTNQENARAGLELYYAHRPRKPVVAIAYTHSHADHFGGVKGVVDEAAVSSGQVKIYAPAGFIEEAVSENVLAGNAMVRRSMFQFGSQLPIHVRGLVDSGLGKAGFAGTITLIAPSELLPQGISKRTIDGLEVLFQSTPGTEAPAEMNLYFPQLRALNLAENATHTLHNLLPLRGALVRDAKAWSRYMSEALELFGRQSEVVLAQHHWPTWGQPRIVGYLSRQRDLYKYLHDQTLRLANHGYTASEIAEQLRLPPSLERDWAARGFYGTVSHNVKAIYQRYLGWYDANPANLNALPPVAAGKKTLEYMGGAAAVMTRAQADFARGEYRWVAQVMSQLVYADPEHRAARELGAAALEQLGYQSESATWRNAYLQGAAELRRGPPAPIAPAFGADFITALSVENIFDLFGVRLQAALVEGRTARINWLFTDTGQRYVMNLENSALTYVAEQQDPRAELSLRLERKTLDAILTQRTSFQAAVAAGALKLDGDGRKLAEVLGALDNFPTNFPVLTPRPTP